MSWISARFDKQQQKVDIGQEILWVLCLMQLLQGVVAGLLASVFHSLVTALVLTTSDVTKLVFARGVLQALSVPIWAALSEHIPRRQFFALVCLVWGVVSLFLAMVNSFWVAAVVLFLHGASLPALGPVSQALITNSVFPSQRGAWFGCLEFVTALGALVVRSLGGAADGNVFAFDVHLWRVMVMLVALCCIGWSVAIWYLSVDADVEGLGISTYREIRYDLHTCWHSYRQRLHRIFKTRSFLVLIWQGFLNGIILNTMTLLPMYISYTGYGDVATSGVMALASFAGVASPILGGIISDYLCWQHPIAGRPMVTFFSAWLSALSLLVLALATPALPIVFLAAVVGFWSLVNNWQQAGTKFPILADVVEQSDQALAAASLVAVEGVLSTFLIAPVTSVMTEVMFHYRFIDHRNSLVQLNYHDAGAIRLLFYWLALPALLLQAIVTFPALRWAYRWDLTRRIQLDGPMDILETVALRHEDFD